MSVTIRDAVRRAAEQFAQLPLSNAQLEAEILLCHVLRCGRSHLLAWPEQPLTGAQQEAFAILAARRAAGEPVAHITGTREFWSLPLAITTDTLIPRPETELLVELALVRMAAFHGAIADLGTGSGAVALALATERPEWSVTATDRSAAALAVAKNNAATHGLQNIRFARGDWCEALGDQRFDLIVSNPPYIAESDPHLRTGDLRFEPATALAAGVVGLDAIRRLARCSRAHLHDDGWLLFEHGLDQGAACRAILAEYHYQEIVTFQDLEQRERVSGGRWRGQTST